jgi:hypothetical protein
MDFCFLIMTCRIVRQMRSSFIPSFFRPLVWNGSTQRKRLPSLFPFFYVTLIRKNNKVLIVRIGPTCCPLSITTSSYNRGWYCFQGSNKLLSTKSQAHLTLFHPLTHFSPCHLHLHFPILLTFQHKRQMHSFSYYSFNINFRI